MAIDTAKKRRSSAASRRMPWMRRFGILPDGSIDQADRQQGSWIYGGISAISAVSVSPVCVTATDSYIAGSEAHDSYSLSAPYFPSGIVAASDSFVAGSVASQVECG